MIMLVAICALSGNVLGVLFTVLAGLDDAQHGASPAGIVLGALFLSIASILWVAVGLHMAGV